MARTVRMEPGEAALAERLRQLRGLPTQQPVLQSSLARGLREEIAEEGVRLYHSGKTLAQAAAQVGIPLSELFAHCVEQNVVLVQNPTFYSHMAALGRSLNLPALTAAAEELAREEQRIAVSA
ncbi:MAG: hypothetical protein HYY42_04480 [Chloroflexi bacterium]|nr:hypothetical protein [Chloroflexota bacterium]